MSVYSYSFVNLLFNDSPVALFFFFFNDTATTEIYTLSLHDALPICALNRGWGQEELCFAVFWLNPKHSPGSTKSEIGRHTSELQSPDHLVCRLLLEKKNSTIFTNF